MEPRSADSNPILEPNDISAVPQLVAEISKLGANLFPGDEAARLALLQATRSLERALEKPRETLVRHTYGHTTAFAAISVGVEAGVWEYMAADDQAKTVAQIAAARNMEEALLARLLKHVAAMGYITETGPDEYRNTNFSRSLALPMMGAGYPLFSRTLSRAVMAMPEHLEKNGYQSPVDNFQYSHGTELGLFEFLGSHPPGSVNFNNFMVGCSLGRPFWVDPAFYPVKDRLLQDFDARDPEAQSADGRGAALLVDVGGGVGEYLSKFIDRFPAVQGRLVLQDLPQVVEQARGLNQRVETMAYDFFTPQPVTGARAYFMHSILHDWPDDACLSILSNITRAMKPGYSRLLINEKVIPATGAHWEATGLDIMMASLLSSKERTEAEWVALLDKAGLKVNHIYTHPHGIESLVECVLVDESGA